MPTIDITEDVETVLSLFEGHDIALGVGEIVENTDLSEERARIVVERLVVEGELETRPVLYERV